MGREREWARDMKQDWALLKSVNSESGLSGFGATPLILMKNDLNATAYTDVSESVVFQLTVKGLTKAPSYYNAPMHKASSMKKWFFFPLKKRSKISRTTFVQPAIARYGSSANTFGIQWKIWFDFERQKNGESQRMKGEMWLLKERPKRELRKDEDVKPRGEGQIWWEETKKKS